ncbi:MAG: hypothetical protein OES47_07195 [Acidobacteriota bacterium]|nr:hypothetical protein [Acidobacteriota bacterium]
MNRQPSNTRTLQILVTAAVIAMFGGNLTLAQGGEWAGEGVSQSQLEFGKGGCGCRYQAAANAETGPACGGRRSGQVVREINRGGRGQGMGTGPGPGPAARSSACGSGSNRDVMQAVRALVHEYRGDIVREIEDVPNGVMTVTRSPENPEAVEVLQRHVGEMKALLEGGGRMRAWDPLFTEIFDHYKEVEMVVDTLDDGVRVTETSANPEVVKLIRAHARKVNEFVAKGPAAVHEPTSLPDDYRDSE